jgi:hypothetical protein
MVTEVVLTAKVWANPGMGAVNNSAIARKKTNFLKLF